MVEVKKRIRARLPLNDRIGSKADILARVKPTPGSPRLSGSRAERRADRFEGLTLRVNAKECGDKRGGAHEPAGQPVGAEKGRAAAALDHGTEERRAGEAAERGPGRIEDGN